MFRMQFGRGGRLPDVQTWLIRTILTVTVVIVYPVKGNRAGAVQASKWFSLHVEVLFCWTIQASDFQIIQGDRQKASHWWYL